MGLKLKIFARSCEPIFEQVTPSRSSGKKGKPLGTLGLKGPKYVGFNRVERKNAKKG